MNELLTNEIEQVSGGDSWGGTPEGRAPADSFRECVIDGINGGGGGGPFGALLKCAVEHLFT